VATRARTPGRDPLATFFRPQVPGGEVDPGEARIVPRDLIDPNPFQPRRQFEQGALDDLAASIREHGVLQPLLVRPLGGRYQIVAGEHRWRAAGIAELARLPCAVRQVADDELEVLTLLENIQRAELDPVDEAHAYRRLLERAGISRRELAARLHKDPEYVAQRLRLISDPQVEEAVRTGVLGPTVGQELARVTDPARRREILGRAASGERVTVREVKLARDAEHRGAQWPPVGPEVADPGAATGAAGADDSAISALPRPLPSATQLLAACGIDVREQLAQLLRFGAASGWSCEELLRQLGL